MRTRERTGEKEQERKNRRERTGEKERERGRKRVCVFSVDARFPAGEVPRPPTVSFSVKEA